MNLQNQRKRRLSYAAAFILLLIVETMIALYVHDTIIRPYVGDMLVVILIYCAIRVMIPVRYKWMPFWIFLFAAGIECLQYFHLIQILKLQDHMFWRIVIGSTFDTKDIGCYGTGCILLGFYEFIRRKAECHE